MIDLKLLRKNPKEIKKLILKKEPTFDVEKLIKLDQQIRQLITETENLRKQRNKLSQQAAQNLTEKLRQQSIEIGKQLKTKEQKLHETEHEFKNHALSCPNLLQQDVPEGDKTKNKVIKTVDKKIEFSFSPKNHLELNEKLNWFDFHTAATISGTNFVVYKNDGLKLLYALINLMIKNNLKYGYEPILPPSLVNEEALVNSGNLPKFRGDFYEIPQDSLCLIPTAEVSLTNLHANQILDSEKLPIRYTAATNCFRREAGGYGADERGLIRIHQFEKVEIYSFCKRKQADEEQKKMLTCAQDLLQQLGLHYQISLLAAQDCSFSSSKTYDIEVWLPGQQKFYEISSCSNCTDFQARRAKIRYRENKKNLELVYTLNGSSLALPRLMVAIMEQFQQENGSIKFPKILQEAVDKVW